MGCNTLNLTQLPNTTVDKLTLARGYTALVTLLLSVVLFGFALLNMTRKYKHYKGNCQCICLFLVFFFANPFFLFAFISLLPVLAYWTVFIQYRMYDPMHGNNLHHNFCKWSGYALVAAESAETWALAIFSLYFLLYYIPFHQKAPDQSMFIDRECVPSAVRIQKNETIVRNYALIPKPTIKYWDHCVAYLLTVILILGLCAIYTSPYFVESIGTGDYVARGYGVVGPWCWIVCEEAQKIFWLYEEWTLMALSSVCLSVAFILILCIVRNPKNRNFSSLWWDKTVLVPFSIFLLYFVIQFVLVVIEILVRIHHNNDPGLWYTYAIGKPLSKILLVVASLQLMSTSYRLGNKKEKMLENNVPPEEPS